jgi:hypothetical protein
VAGYQSPVKTKGAVPVGHGEEQAVDPQEMMAVLGLTSTGKEINQNQLEQVQVSSDVVKIRYVVLE